MPARKDFKPDDKIQRLLWCDRHCCLCEKSCGVNIEFAHIENPECTDIDNAIPVCYDCHAQIGMYNAQHPKGTKYKSKELKKRREQIYDKYTKQYIAPLHYVISNKLNPHEVNSGPRQYPKTTFNITNLSDYLPAVLRIQLKGKLNGKYVDLGLSKGLYTGAKYWNLNPRRQINGWFEIANKKMVNPKPNDLIEVRVLITIIDVLGREHRLLEDGYTYAHRNGEQFWYFEP